MTSSHEGERTDGEKLRPLEKNNYFDGKLMTARDMRAEQDYHADRQHRLTRFVAGAGIISGLNVTAVEERDDGLEVTVDDGVALDGYGRPIVVTGADSIPVTRSGSDQSSVPDGDVIYLSLRYDELEKESVPVPGSESAYEPRCEYNRFLETFEISYDESAPGRYKYKPVPAVEFPDRDDVRDTDDSALAEIARSYHDSYQSEDRDDPSLFLGAFERDSNGAWTELPETERRPLVYTNDMLYAAIVRHVTDFDNPHEVSDVPGSGDGISERLTALEQYVMERSLRFTIRSFSTIEERFNAEIASEIVDRTREAVDQDEFEDKDDYFAFLDRLADSERELVGELEDDVTTDSLDRYEEALDELESTLDGEEDVLRVAVAQDVLSETADLLRRKEPRVLWLLREVPDLIGKHRRDAQEELLEDDDDWIFTIEEKAIRDKDSEGIEVNHVMKQTPEPGEEAYVRHQAIRLQIRVPYILRGDDE